ncbi:lipase secretion chaperone [Marinobacter sp. M1N3S26]|uniref:lipase secretion chaperone n=1 Tax=unclassified Marinobacter TaxID=83889 RepID=UPI00387B761B
MKPTTLIAGLLALIVIGGVAGYSTILSDDPDSPVAEKRAGPVPANVPTAPGSGEAVETDASTSWDQRVSRLAARLRNDYGDTIDEPATQAYLFVEREKLADTHPRDGRALFETAVAMAFPDRSASILALMAGMDRYHQWLSDNELTLREMPLLQRRAAIWKQRQAIFGARASEIWGEEETVASKNADAVREELTRLDQAHELTPEEVAHQLSTTVDDLYGLEAASQLVTPQALGQALFAMESVQTDLAAMSAEERQQRIDSLRRQMGYSEEDVRRLEQLDRQRNQRWQEGEAYMAERRELGRQYQGEQLEQALDRLRQAHFGDTAPTIAREEEQGFFRFQRERRYGLN